MTHSDSDFKTTISMIFEGGLIDDWKFLLGLWRLVCWMFWNGERGCRLIGRIWILCCIILIERGVDLCMIEHLSPRLKTCWWMSIVMDRKGLLGLFIILTRRLKRRSRQLGKSVINSKTAVVNRPESAPLLQTSVYCHDLLQISCNISLLVGNHEMKRLSSCLGYHPWMSHSEWHIRIRCLLLHGGKIALQCPIPWGHYKETSSLLNFVSL